MWAAAAAWVQEPTGREGRVVTEGSCRSLQKKSVVFAVPLCARSSCGGRCGSSSAAVRTMRQSRAHFCWRYLLPWFSTGGRPGRARRGGGGAQALATKGTEQPRPH